MRIDAEIRPLRRIDQTFLNGDSGGPVFGSAGVAFGIVHGRGSGQFVNDMYFMPAHRFSAIGASVLTTP